MKLRIIAIGKIKNKFIKEIVHDYSSRIVHYFPIERIDTKDDLAALKIIEATDYLIICDRKGKQRDSRDFATYLRQLENRRIKRVLFFIGGPDGAGDQIKKRANELLSFSQMTFPHELSQAILLEQIYRAGTILKGEAYHK